MPATLEIPTGISGLGSGMTVDIFPDGSDTPDVSAGTTTESTNRKGVYTYSNASLTGLKYLSLKNNGNLLGYGWAYLATTGTCQLEESRSAALMQWAGAPVKSNIKKNQALGNFGFMMTDSTNHQPVTGKLGSLSIMRSLDGGAYASGTLGGFAEISNGAYSVNLGAGDMNANVVLIRATATACDDTIERIVTEP